MRFVAKFLEHWKLYLIPLVLFPIIATVYGQHTLSVYESSAYIRVEGKAVVGSTTLAGIGGNPYNSPAQNAVDAINELLQSENFAVSVAKNTDIAKQYDLSVRANQDLVAKWIQQEVFVMPSTVGQEAFNIVVDDKSPRLARQIATSLLTQFETDYTQRELNNYKQAESMITEQIAQKTKQVAQDNQRIIQYEQAHPNISPTDPTLAAYQSEYQQDAAQLKAYQDQLNQLHLSEFELQSDAISIFTVLDPPSLPLKPTLKLKKLLVYPGGGLGLALALIALIVGLQTAFDRSVYTQQDVRAILEELDLDIASIEAVPVLYGIGDRMRDEDEGSTYSGVLVPVLTVLPQLRSEEMTQELRRAVGVGADETR